LYLSAKELTQDNYEKLDILKSICVLYDVKFNEKGLLETSNEYFDLSEKIKNSGNIDSNTATSLGIINSILSKRNLLKKEFIEPKETGPIKELNLTAIGYWKSDLEPHLPHPKNFQVEYWDENEKTRSD
jgi:hypothetical protein